MIQSIDSLVKKDQIIFHAIFSHKGLQINAIVKDNSYSKIVFFIPNREGMMNDTQSTLLAAMYRLLQPLTRILLRYGIPCGSLIDLIKRAYVETAQRDFALPGKKQTDSRISVLTGLTRKEVKQIRDDVAPLNTDSVARYNRAARVISGWIQDRAYLDGWGSPMILPLEGEGATLTGLVHCYGGDIPVRAVLDELLRVGAVEQLPDARLKLLQRAYVPNTSETDKLSILGMDTTLLLETLEHNLDCSPGDSYFQRKVAYDNLPEEAIPVLRTLAAQHGQRLLEELNTWLNQQDRDNNSNISGSGRKYAGVGVYFFEKDTEDK